MGRERSGNSGGNWQRRQGRGGGDDGGGTDRGRGKGEVNEDDMKEQQSGGRRQDNGRVEGRVRGGEVSTEQGEGVQGVDKEEDEGQQSKYDGECKEKGGGEGWYEVRKVRFGNRKSEGQS